MNRRYDPRRANPGRYNQRRNQMHPVPSFFIVVIGMLLVGSALASNDPVFGLGYAFAVFATGYAAIRGGRWLIRWQLRRWREMLMGLRRGRPWWEFWYFT